jgi:hypothetical protein
MKRRAIHAHDACGLILITSYVFWALFRSPHLGVKPLTTVSHYSAATATAIKKNCTTTSTTPTLSFSTCNGFTNQRLSLLYGLVIAKQTGRRVVWPTFMRSGIQRDSQQVLSGRDGVNFEHFYDKRIFLAFAKRHSLVFVHGPEEPQSTRHVSVVDQNDEMAKLMDPDNHHYHSVAHVELGCPLFKLKADEMVKHRALVAEFLASLRPNPRFESVVLSAEKNLGKRSSSQGNYNFLHLRIEQDWIEHCGSWRVADPAHDNCITNTFSIHDHLALKGIEPHVPLYLGLDWQSVNMQLVDMVLAKLKHAGYSNIIVHKDVFLEEEGQHQPIVAREESAMVEYSLALRSAKFIGNSVSTFSAMVILERQMKDDDAWSSYYNMGDIPLAEFLPFFDMPWVFTYNGHSPEYDYMLRAAVASGIANGNVKPYCIYDGSENDTIYRWLVSMGVHMIIHHPKWVDRVEEIAQAASKHLKQSPLYLSQQKIIGTLQRLDIPVIKALAHHNYVLFTDADVFFLRPISLDSFSKQLPETLAMAFEMDDVFPCNAGVMLMNLPEMRISHRSLIDFTFANPSLHFGPYGPLDQGALNQFYQHSMKGKCSLSESFNAKPYKTDHRIGKSHILHFHGPKPDDYLRWLRTNRCSFGSKCRAGITQICRHAHVLAAANGGKGGTSPTYQDLHQECRKRNTNL